MADESESPSSRQQPPPTTTPTQARQHQQHHRSYSASTGGGGGADNNADARSPTQLHQHRRAKTSPDDKAMTSFFFATASTESIVKRVEEEIGNARKASVLAKSRIGVVTGNVVTSSPSSATTTALSPKGATSGAAAPVVDDDPVGTQTTANNSTNAQSSSSRTSSSTDAKRLAMMLTVNAVELAESSSSSTATTPGGGSSSLAREGSMRTPRSLSSRGYSSNDHSEYEPSFDLMEDILNIQETDSELMVHHPSESHGSGRNSNMNNEDDDDEDDADAHFQHAMDVIGEEFETTTTTTTAPPPPTILPTRSLSKAQSSLYDDDEDELMQQGQNRPYYRSVGSTVSSRSHGSIDADGGGAGVVGNETDRSSTTSSDRVVMEALSNGETAGLRARAILDTLKSRREHFSTTFRTGGGGMGGGTGSARSSPDVLVGSHRADDANAATATESPPPSAVHDPTFTATEYHSRSYSERHDSSNTEADEKKDDDPSSLSTMHADKDKSTTSTLTVNTMAAATSTTTPTAHSSSTPTPTAMMRVSLPAPDRKKFKSRSKQVKGGASTPSPAQAASAASISTLSSPAASALVASPPHSSRRKTPLSKSGASPSTPSSQATPSTSRRIRFRDPFPVLKPSSRPRDPQAMIAAHAVPAPIPVTHWLRPKNDLRQLIVAVMGSSIQRRAHACGALKVLTQTKKNQLMLMRTDSFLEALVFASSQDIPAKQRRGAATTKGSGSDGDTDDDEEEHVENPNRHRTGDDAMLAIDARTRAVSCLRNICEPKDNRGHVILYPGFKEALMYVIQDNIPEGSAAAAGGSGDEARVIACGAFALLAKSPECRETFVTTPGLVDLLARVMAGEVGASPHEAKDVSAAVSNDVNVSRSGTLSQNTSVMSKQSSMSGRREDHDHEDDDDDDEDEDDEDDRTDASDDDHSHDSSHTSEYTSQASDTEDDEGDDEEDDLSSARASPKSSKRKDHARVHRTHPRRHRPVAKKDSGASSLPVGADDELAHMSSIRQINQELRAEYLQRARSNACAALIHLSKHCAILNRLCNNKCLIQKLLAVSHEHDNPIHTKCLEILCNLSRFPANSSSLTRFPGLVDALVSASDAPESVVDDRVHALRALQNMSADSSSKTLLATEAVLSSLSAAALRSGEDEKEAAVAFLYNVSTEPGAVVSITNTKNVVATLVHLAHHPDSSPNVRLMSCDALATISLWLQTLAGTGKVPVEVPNVPLPSQKTTGWERWD